MSVWLVTGFFALATFLVILKQLCDFSGASITVLKFYYRLRVNSNWLFFNLTWQGTVFLRIQVTPEYTPPPIRSRIKPENFILKAIAYRISSNIDREITTEKTYKPWPVFEEILYLLCKVKYGDS